MAAPEPSGPEPSGADPFRFFDNREKYLMFVTTTSEKAMVSQRIGKELALLEPRPPAVRIFDAGTGNGVVLANVLHLQTAEDAARLIRHHARALREDGELVIVDMVGGPGFEAGLIEAVYQLHLGMRTRRGRAHDVESLATCDRPVLRFYHPQSQIKRHGL